MKKRFIAVLILSVFVLSAVAMAGCYELNDTDTTDVTTVNAPDTSENISDTGSGKVTTADNGEDLPVAGERKLIYVEFCEGSGAPNATPMYDYREMSELKMLLGGDKQNFLETYGKRTFAFNGKEISADYIVSTKYASVCDELAGMVNYYACQDDAGGTYYVLSGTDRVVRYTNNTVQNAPVTKEITREEAEKICDAFMINLLGGDYSSKYECDYILLSNNVYTARYFRKIGEYNTEDAVTIDLNKNGDVYLYSGYYVGIFDDPVARGILTTENIEKADAELGEAVRRLNLSDLKIQRRSIHVDEKGDYYLRYYTIYSSDKPLMGFDAAQFCIKIG